MASTAQQNNTNPKETTKISAVNYAKRFTASLKRHIWLLAAFFIPLTIRSIPEMISWPYPLGYDTINMFTQIESGQFLLSGPLFFLRSQLFYTFETLVYWAIGDFSTVIKIFGPLLMASVAVMMFLYAKRGLGWRAPKAFLVSFLLAIYFVSLRNSWDLYAQSFGLIFLFATLTVLKTFNSPRRYIFASVFMLLTVFSHQLVSVILFFILIFEALRLLHRKSYRDFLFTFFSSSLAGAFFLFRTYSMSYGSIVIPSNAAVEPPFTFALTLMGLLLYGYGLLLPLAVVGLFKLKDWFLRFWVIWCFSAMLLLVAFPSLPLYYWPRWYYLLVYPLLFFAAEGLERLYRLWSQHKHKIKRLLPKTVAISYVALLLALSGFYMAATPENQLSFFSADNPYLVYFPSTMLQNMLSITDNPSLVNCFDWISNNSAIDAAVVMHYALYDLAEIYLPNRLIINVPNSRSIYNHLQNQTTLVDGMIDASSRAMNSGNSTVYTVWWISGKGWYDIPSLPSNFVQVYRSGELAVYVFHNT
jgi:hypothetical protein